MASTLLTIQKITNEALFILENSLGFTGKINREYSDNFGVAGAKIGTTLNVRLPVQYTVSTGQALDLQDVKETQVAVRLDTQNHVDFQFSSQDLLLDVDLFSERFLRPAVVALANKIDYNGLAKAYKAVGQHVGVPGTTPSSLLTYMQAGAKLNYAAVPQDQRFVAFDPTMEVTLVNALGTYFHASSEIENQYRTGTMRQAGGFKFFMDQNIATHTCGTVASSTPLTNGTTADGATSIITNGWNSGATTLKEGDVISVAGLYAVNPQTKQSTGQLKQFVCTQDMSDSGGAITIPISPAINLTGAYQNCYYNGSVVANDVAIYVMDKTGSSDLGNYVSAKATPQALAFHKDFATLATADLPLPGGPDMAARASDKQSGLSVRIIRQYDINTDMWPCRLDILYGWAVLRPEMACRISA